MIEKYDINILNTYIEEEKLKNSYHESLPLIIWNYHDRVQHEVELWDDITMACRALVTDLDGNIIARSFSKFFNFEEKPIDLSRSYRIFEKMDGSLGLLFYYENKWIFSSRGSFTSDQTIMGLQILTEMNINIDNLRKDISYVFEIIYPENRVVVNYGNDRKLIYLSSFDRLGNEHLLLSEMKTFGFDVVEEVTHHYSGDFKTLQLLNTHNKEGFVIRFDDGERIKIKFADYIELHRIKDNVNVKLVIESILEHNFDTIINKIPDEFMNWFKETHTKINQEIYILQEKILNCFDTFYKLNPTCVKSFAISINQLEKDYKTIFFILYRNNIDIYDNRIHKIIVKNMINPLDYEEYFIPVERN